MPQGFSNFGSTVKTVVKETKEIMRTAQVDPTIAAQQAMSRLDPQLDAMLNKIPDSVGTGICRKALKGMGKQQRHDKLMADMYDEIDSIKKAFPDKLANEVMDGLAARRNWNAYLLENGIDIEFFGPYVVEKFK